MTENNTNNNPTFKPGDRVVPNSENPFEVLELIDVAD